MEYTNSKQLFAEACELIPGGVNSPVRAFKAVGDHPVFIERGEGAYLYDVDGNKYVDYICSWGPLLLGHQPEAVGIFKIRKRIVDLKIVVHQDILLS